MELPYPKLTDELTPELSKILQPYDKPILELFQRNPDKNVSDLTILFENLTKREVLALSGLRVTEQTVDNFPPLPATCIFGAEKRFNDYLLVITRELSKHQKQSSGNCC